MDKLPKQPQEPLTEVPTLSDVEGSEEFGHLVCNLIDACNFKGADLEAVNMMRTMAHNLAVGNFRVVIDEPIRAQ